MLEGCSVLVGEPVVPPLKAFCKGADAQGRSISAGADMQLLA